MRAGQLRRAPALATFVALAWLMTLVIPTLSAATPGIWSRPVPVDHFAPTRFHHLADLQCPSRHLCLALDDQGSVITSTDPAGGRGAWRVTFPFSGAPFESDYTTMPLHDLGCPAADLCVLGGAHDDLRVSIHPTGGPAAWSVVQLPGSAQIQAVACPSSSLCLAVDVAGNVFYSANPTGGASAWHEYHVAALDGAALNGGFPGQVALSCPSENLCAAVNGVDGAVVTTVDPEGGSAAWQSRTVDTNNKLRAISCPSRDLCAAFDGRNVITSTAPATGSWASAHLRGGDGQFEIPSISCPSSRLCLASYGYTDTVFVSRDPAGGAPAWRRTARGARWTAVSCPASNLCVGVTYNGRIFTSSKPPGGHWAVEFADGYNAIRGLSCPSPHLCVAVDVAGNALISAHPTRSPRAWRATKISSRGLTSISCPASTLCVAVDANGDIIRSTHVSAGRSAWRHVLVAPWSRRGRPVAVACPTVRLCVAVGGQGYLWTTAHPARGARAWKRVKISRASGAGRAYPLSSVACHGPELCVGGDASGDLFVSRRPTHGPAWTGKNVGDPGESSTSWSLTCPSRSLCLAADGLGALDTTTDPAGGGWHHTFGEDAIEVDAPLDFRFATCASPSLCFLYGTGGRLYSSHHPTDGSSWRGSDVNPSSDQGDLTAMACLPKSSVCVAADDFGDLLTRG